MFFMSGNTVNGSAEIDIYEKCSSCGHQKKSVMAQRGSFNAKNCEKCGSESMSIVIGASEPPAWWKP